LNNPETPNRESHVSDAHVRNGDTNARGRVPCRYVTMAMFSLTSLSNVVYVDVLVRDQLLTAAKIGSNRQFNDDLRDWPVTTLTVQLRF
jgi:hypothetical protein